MKITLYMAMTVNGYIATTEDETPWSDEVWEAYYAFVQARAAMIVGRRTYEFMQENGEFEKLGFPLTAVVSHSTLEAGKNIFCLASPKEAVEFMRAKGVKEVVIGGGGKLNADFLQAGLLDEIVLEIDPRIFGRGVRLFDQVDAQAQLELVEVKKLSKNTVRLQYKVVK